MHANVIEAKVLQLCVKNGFRRPEIERQTFFTVILPEVWPPPQDWISANLPVVYRSFDNDKYVQLENGAQVVAGKVGYPENYIIQIVYDL